VVPAALMSGAAETCLLGASSLHIAMIPTTITSLPLPWRQEVVAGHYG